jgi:hypothetical protein
MLEFLTNQSKGENDASSKPIGYLNLENLERYGKNVCLGPMQIFIAMTGYG